MLREVQGPATTSQTSLPLHVQEKQSSDCCIMNIVKNIFNLLAECFKKLLPCFFKDKTTSTLSSRQVQQRNDTTSTDLFKGRKPLEPSNNHASPSLEIPQDQEIDNKSSTPTHLDQTTTVEEVETLLEAGASPVEKKEYAILPPYKIQSGHTINVKWTPAQKLGYDCIRSNASENEDLAWATLRLMKAEVQATCQEMSHVEIVDYCKNQFKDVWDSVRLGDRKLEIKNRLKDLQISGVLNQLPPEDLMIAKDKTFTLADLTHIIFPIIAPEIPDSTPEEQLESYIDAKTKSCVGILLEDGLKTARKALDSDEIPSPETKSDLTSSCAILDEIQVEITEKLTEEDRNKIDQNPDIYFRKIREFKQMIAEMIKK